MNFEHDINFTSGAAVTSIDMFVLDNCASLYVVNFEHEIKFANILLTDIQE